MFTGRVCYGAAAHRPRYAEVDRHHVFPKYLASLLSVPAISVTVDLCSGCHDLTHHLIHHLINDGEIGGHRPPDRVARLAREAYSWWTQGLLAGGAT